MTAIPQVNQKIRVVSEKTDNKIVKVGKVYLVLEIHASSGVEPYVRLHEPETVFFSTISVNDFTWREFDPSENEETDLLTEYEQDIQTYRAVRVELRGLRAWLNSHKTKIKSVLRHEDKTTATVFIERSEW